MITEELIVNAIVFLAGLIVKRPIVVETVIAKFFTKKIK